jgi:streptogramin lyase
MHLHEEFAMRSVLAVSVLSLALLAGCNGSGSSSPSSSSQSPVANAGGPYSGTAGATAVKFSAAGSTDPRGETLTYAWNFGDGSTGSGVSPTHTYAVSGLTGVSHYSVYLTVTDTDGLTGTTTADAAISPPTPLSDGTLTGLVISGNTIIVGAHVYLMAANTLGYGLSSTSLLNAAETGKSDNIGAYVTSGLDGTFSLTGKYTCTSGQQLYIYSQGGSSTTGTSTPAIGLLAAIGNCPSSTSPAIYATVNEVSTIAMAYAVSGFATNATSVSSSGSALALVDLANAFANASNLENLATGVARATTPAGYGTVPQSNINMLANILSSCVNPIDSVSNSCTILFANTHPANMSGTVPTETATAAINMAQNPTANIATLYSIPLYAPPYTPTITTQPNDFTIALSFTGGGLNGPAGIAIDGSGNAWVANTGSSSVTKISSAGVVLSGTNGYTGGGLNGPNAIAIDGSGNAWITNQSTNGITELTGAGAAVSGSPFAAGSGPDAIAIDGSGNVWVANYSGNSVTKLTSAGSAVSGSPFTGRGLNEPDGVAIDSYGNAWIANYGGNSVTELASTGSAVTGSPYTVGSSNAPEGIAIDNYSNAWTTIFNNNSVIELNSSGSSAIAKSGLKAPTAVAIDGSGNVWIVNQSGNLVTEFSNAGSLLSGATGFTASSVNTPRGIAIDGSGDVWITNISGNSVTEFVGVGTPVVTPLAAGVKNTSLGSQP